LNVIPHEKHRVKLAGATDDYINASLIDSQSIVGPGTSVDYIAASAPVTESFCDFWRMIWQQDVRIILMLTKEYEADAQKKKPIRKAHKYWPDQTETPDFKAGLAEKINPKTAPTDLVVTQKDYRLVHNGGNKQEISIRVFVIKHTKLNQDREITHIQYSGWPDHGVPDEKDQTFMNLLQEYRQCRTKWLQAADTKGKPKVVLHCSAGIGRTGTFAALDMILDLIEHELKSSNLNPSFNVFDCVRKMRICRPGMVQTKDQYAFIARFLKRCLQSPPVFLLPSLTKQEL